MKKILYAVILTLIFAIKVEASEIYYSDYGQFSEYQTEKVEITDVINVEEVTMYRWYKEVITPGDFKLYNKQDNFNNNCYETEYSSWNIVSPVVNDATILEQRTIYDYQMIKPIRYIHLYNLNGSYSAFRITELQVFYDNQEINYTYQCDGCWQDFDKYIHNGIYEENMAIIDDGGSLIIDLGKEYPINKINLIIYLFDIGTEDKEYTLGYSQNGTDIFINKSYKKQFTLFYAKDSIRFDYNIDNLKLDSGLWLYSQTSQEKLDNEFVYSLSSHNEYRYKEKMCQTYSMSKDYYPQYSAISVDDYNYKDSPQKFYRYQKRDKLELNIFDITQKDYDLNNFILSSTDEYEIKHNIDWNKNGVYNVDFILNDLIVSKNVNVSILENVIEEKDKEIDNLKQNLQNTISEYETTIKELEDINNEYLNDVNKLNQEIIVINNQILNMKDENVQNNEYFNKIINDFASKIDEYDEKVKNLESINITYLRTLDILSNEINDLKNEINNLKTQQQSNESEVITIKDELEKYINEYQQKLDYIQNFNDQYIIKLDEANTNIKNLNDKLIKLNLDAEEKYIILNKKIEENEKKLTEAKKIINDCFDKFNDLNFQIELIKNYLQEKEIENEMKHDDLYQQIEMSNNQNYEKILDMQADLLNQINSYNQTISDLKNSNEQYLLEINYLKQQLIKITSDIEEIKKQNISSYSEFRENQNLIYEKILENNEELINIKEEQVNYDDIKIIKDNVLTLSNSIDEAQTNNLNHLPTKNNDYFLKINGVNIVNLLWLYVILAFLFFVYVINLFKKCRRKKSSSFVEKV